MKRLALGLATVMLVGAAAVFSDVQPPRPEFDFQREERNPVSNFELNNAPKDFQFAVVSDRTGGHRARIFSQAVDQLNLLQPEFVVSVGDLIEGSTQDTVKVAAEWREFQSYVHRLKMPFFYLPGNHDISNAPMEQLWREKFGRRYYHFVYRNVLFLMLDSEDPPGRAPGAISAEQVAYARKALEENRGVRWTFVFVHQPLWDDPSIDKNGWGSLEAQLADRKYTVFAGHIHMYKKFVRQGASYYQLATTGGASKLRGINYGEFDEIAWVTMKDSGPIVANVLLDGIYREDMTRPVTAEESGPPYAPKPVQPAGGMVLLDGKPVPDAYVVFQAAKGGPRADAITEADGTFKLSTHKAGDGCPVADYAVTIIQPKPFYDSTGKFGPNQLPEKYSRAETSGLNVKVLEGTNYSVFELQTAK